MRHVACVEKEVTLDADIKKTLLKQVDSAFEETKAMDMVRVDSWNQCYRGHMSVPTSASAGG